MVKLQVSVCHYVTMMCNKWVELCSILFKAFEQVGVFVCVVPRGLFLHFCKNIEIQQAL